LPAGPLGTALAGTLVSSLHRLKDTDNNDGAFFVFGDLSIKIEGEFRLQFNLYEMRDKECFHMQSALSDSFTVYPQKNFPGMSESTFLTRSFSDQGVRLRLRKEPRTLLRKRGPASDDYQPRQYRNSHNRQQSQSGERQGIEPQDPSGTRQQTEHQEMQLPIHTPSYEQRQQISRTFSQSTASASGYSDDASNKRPRTGSEQSSTFSQHQPLDSPQYPPRMFSGSAQSFSDPFAAQQQPYGYTYTQSPQSSSMSSRDQYFAQRLNTQAGNSPFDPSSQRSPQSAYFPPQPNAIRYQTQPLLAPSPPQRTHSAQTQSSFEGLGLNTRTQMSPAMQATGMTGMQPPTYGRMNTAPAYGGLAQSSTYGDYPTHSGPMGASLLGTRGPSMSTTSAPGL
jgi:hypothetical protein